MWKFIGRWAVKIALFAFEHKEEVIAVVEGIQAAKAEKAEKKKTLGL